MKLLKRYAGAALYQAKDGRLFVRIGRTGTFQCNPGDRVLTRYGYVTVELPKTK